MNNKRLIIHYLRNENESNGDGFFRGVFGHFNAALRISDRTKVIGFIHEKILSAKSVWKFLGGNEITAKFIFLLPLLWSRKFAFTINILNVLDG